MNIPSNSSLAEVVKYYLPVEIKELVETLLEPFMNKVTMLEEQAETDYKEWEILNESDSSSTSF